MAVLHDATTVSTQGTTAASPLNITHAAGAGCSGVVCCITVGGVSTDVVTGVTYGGTAMTRIRTDNATSTEAGRTYIYFLGAGVPQASGNQTCAISYGADTTAKTATCTTLRSSYGARQMVAISSSGFTNSAITAGGTFALGTEAHSDSAMSFASVFSGTAGPVSSIGGGGTCTSSGGVTVMANDITGVLTGGTFRQTTANDGSFPITFTQAADDFCASAISVVEYGTDWSSNFPTPESDEAREVFPVAPALGPASYTLAVPTSDVSMLGWTSNRTGFSYFQDIDDGYSYAASDGIALSEPTGNAADFTVGFNLSPGRVSQVKVFVAAFAGVGSRSCFTQILDGTTIIGTSPNRLVTAAGNNRFWNDTFSGISMDADNLFVKFAASGGSGTTMAVSQIWVEVVRDEETLWAYPDWDLGNELTAPAAPAVSQFILTSMVVGAV